MASGGQEKTLSDLLQHGLKDIYYAETKIQKTLPKLISAAHDENLKSALSDHLEETGDQIGRLEQVFEIMGVEPKAEKCDAIDGILKEGDDLMEQFGQSKAGDAAIIFSCQAVEHYEMTRYGSMHTYATELGMDDVAVLLEQTLLEERNADKKLSSIAEERVNFAAGT
jgi:ferritin-like metal-binding protein YciE